MALNKRTKKARIRFSTQIIKRLGEELNPSVDQSILELVKNSYDADALNCTVVLDNITEIGGSIKITEWMACIGRVYKVHYQENWAGKDSGW